MEVDADDTGGHDPQHEGVYKWKSSTVVVAEGDTPIYTSLKRLTSVSSDPFNGASLSIMDSSDLKGETVSILY